MSYNIDRWTTLEMLDLRIPLNSISEKYELEKDDDKIRIDLSTEGEDIVGYIDSNDLVVTKIELLYTWSGNALSDLIDILSKSTGFLDAILIWEGGGSMSRLTVSDGVVIHGSLDIIKIIKENNQLSYRVLGE